MRKGQKLLATLGLAIGVMVPAAAQITITATDVNNAFAAGKTLYTYSDNTTVLLNIGNLGGSNVWDFTSLHVNSSSTMTTVDPSSTPYAAEFLGATYALKIDSTVQGFPTSIYQYFILSTNLLDPGRKMGVSSGGASITISTRNSPPAVYYALPSSYQTSWSTVYDQNDTTRIEFPPLPPNITATVTSHRDSSIVDAYGTMKLPGGLDLPALRIRQVLRSPDLFVDYIFIAKEGVVVTVEGMDTLSSTGTIPIAGASWLSTIAVGVSEEKTTPTEFALDQNFPNPFNPATVIGYQVPVSSNVRLTVFDVLGREVAVLVNEMKAPGNYKATFDPKGLSSGVYVYRLEAGNFVQTRRMVLVK